MSDTHNTGCDDMTAYLASIDCRCKHAQSALAHDRSSAATALEALPPYDRSDGHDLNRDLREVLTWLPCLGRSDDRSRARWTPGHYTAVALERVRPYVVALAAVYREQADRDTARHAAWDAAYAAAVR